MISMDKAVAAQQEADEVGLYGADWFCALTHGDVSRACNGCGPEWMSTGGRERLTNWLDLFYTAFCMHDCRFAFSNDGTREKFDAANDELLRNCRLLADERNGWWNPMRYVWRARAKLVHEACADFGWSAWRDAYSEAKKGGKE